MIAGIIIKADTPNTPQEKKYIYIFGLSHEWIEKVEKQKWVPSNYWFRLLSWLSWPFLMNHPQVNYSDYLFSVFCYQILFMVLIIHTWVVGMGVNASDVPTATTCDQFCNQTLDSRDPCYKWCEARKDGNHLKQNVIYISIWCLDLRPPIPDKISL